MQLFVIVAYSGKINTMASKSAKETEKMIRVEWGGKFPCTTRLKKDKEYTLNIVGNDFSMWGRDNGELVKRFREAMKETLEKREKEIACIESYLKEVTAFPAPPVKSDKKNKSKKCFLKLVKSSKV